MTARRRENGFSPSLSFQMDMSIPCLLPFQQKGNNLRGCDGLLLLLFKLFLPPSTPVAV
jgi:hypothetical protein